MKTNFFKEMFAQIGDTFAQIGLVGECPQVLHTSKVCSDYVRAHVYSQTRPAPMNVFLACN
jgi:hypothetical protein